MTTNIAVIAAISAQPWRMSPTMRPKANTSAAGIRKIASICAKFESGVGFSYGCAELALKKPPPLVPSILIASCEATGPMAIDCVAAFASSISGSPLASFSGWPSGPFFGCCQALTSSVVALALAAKFWTTPWPTRKTANTSESGSST